MCEWSLCPGEEAEVLASAVGVCAGVAAGVPVQPEDVDVAQVEEGVPLLQVGVNQLNLATGAVGVRSETQVIILQDSCNLLQRSRGYMFFSILQGHPRS